MDATAAADGGVGALGVGELGEGPRADRLAADRVAAGEGEESSDNGIVSEDGPAAAAEEEADGSPTIATSMSETELWNCSASCCWMTWYSSSALSPP